MGGLTSGKGGVVGLSDRCHDDDRVSRQRECVVMLAINKVSRNVKHWTLMLPRDCALGGVSVCGMILLLR